MKRVLIQVGVALAALAALVFVGARAFAHGPDAWQHHLQKKLEGVLDAAKATPQQRAAVHAAVEHVVTTMAETHQSRGAEMSDALALFEADKLDAAAIQAHRDRQTATMKKVSDAVVQAIFDAHDALTPAQRKAVAEHIRVEHSEHAGGGVREEIMKRMVSSRIDDALDAAKVTDAQRATAHAARDRVFAVIEEIHRGRSADLDQALALFTADKLDGAKVDALRAQHFASMQRACDAVVQAVTDVHDALDAGQRKALADYVRNHRPQHFGHHG